MYIFLLIFRWNNRSKIGLAFLEIAWLAMTEPDFKFYAVKINNDLHQLLVLSNKRKS